jgi:DNA-binding response OmpR family regulator
LADYTVIKDKADNRKTRLASGTGGVAVTSDQTKNGNYTILVVDDERTNRAIFGLHLRRRGFHVIEAVTGEEALEHLATQPSIHLVLLDIVMPGMNGLQVLEVIRRSLPAVELPVIMVTAEEEDGKVIRAFELGANDYVTKPVNIEVTMARIAAHLKESALSSNA